MPDLNDEELQRLRQLFRWVDTFKITGPYVTGRNGGLNGGAAYYVNAKATPSPQPRARRFELVKITGTESGGGKYVGVLFKKPGSDQDILGSGNLTEAELGTQVTDADNNPVPIRILNTRELSKSTHDIASSGFLPVHLLAMFLKTASDGVDVYVTEGLQWKDCG